MRRAWPPFGRPGRVRLPWWGWPLAGVLIFATGVGGAFLATPGTEVAAWWPAAGLSVCFALLVPPRQQVFVLVLVLVVTGAANAWTGRELGLSIAYGIANTLEVAVVVYGLRIARPHPFTLRSLPDAIVFALIAAAGAIVAGIAAGAAGAIWSGGDFWASAAIVAASHSAAVLLIAPFAALPEPLPDTVSLRELGMQSVLLALTVFAAFRPGAVIPVGFLVFVGVCWGALRLPAVIALAESLVVAVSVLALTVSGDGSFVSAAYTPAETSIATVSFMSALGWFTLVLVSARHEIRSANIARLEAATARAEAANEQAATLAARLELTRQRDDFVASTSHELRTPITSIVGYTDLLLDGDQHEPERGWVLAIERNAGRLLHLVEDLLSLGTTRASRTSGPELFAIGELVTEAEAGALPFAGARSITLTTDVPSDLAGYGDRAELARALGHLVSNAVKFAPDGGTVAIAAARADDADGAAVTISVTDTGPGMDAETVANAFEKFYRGADAVARVTAGTGVGLSIAQDLAARNGAVISLHSVPGEGTTAELTVPAGPAAAL